MSTRNKILLYGLQSQKRISQINAQKILHKKGFVLNERNKNCLYPHNRKETLKHWIAKALIFKILRERNRNVGTEIEVGDGIADVFDEDNKITYEIENKFSRKINRQKVRNFYSAKNIFFINLRKMPNDIYEAQKYLEKIVV